MRLVDLLVTHQITMLQLVPSLLQMVLEEKALATCQACGSLCAGETLTHALERFCFRLTADLHNPMVQQRRPSMPPYWTCARGSPPGRMSPLDGPLPIHRLYILDTQLYPVPIGVPGELYIGGVGLAQATSTAQS